MRIVSLLPSATEIVAALGHEAELVGRSAECDFPPAIRNRAIVMRPRVLDSERPSGEIDARVRESRARDESLYVIDAPALRRLRPDIILTQDLCGVCSVTGDEVSAACREAGVDPTIVSLTPRTLVEIWQSIRTVGEALGDRTAADRLLAHLEHRARRREPRRARARVAVIEWLDPPIVAGLWAPDMVERAGGTYSGPPAGQPGQVTTWPALAESRADLVILAPCSFSVDRTRREIDHAHLDEALAELRPSLGIWVADEAYFSRPGPRLVDGVELLHSRLYETPFTPPMPVRPWVPLEA